MQPLSSGRPCSDIPRHHHLPVVPQVRFPPPRISTRIQLKQAQGGLREALPKCSVSSPGNNNSLRLRRKYLFLTNAMGRLKKSQKQTSKNRNKGSHRIIKSKVHPQVRAIRVTELASFPSAPLHHGVVPLLPGPSHPP